MFDLSPEKIIVLLVLGLVVLGPGRLPQAARTLGRIMSEVRRVSGTFQTEVRGALAEPTDVLNKAVGDLGIPSLRSTVRDTVTGAISPFSEIGSTTSSAQATPTGETADAVPSPPRPAVPDDPSLN